MKNNTLYLLRHGQAEWNVQGRLQGSKNSPLTEKGKRQSEKMAEFLKRVKIDLLIASPLERVRDTIEIIKNSVDISVVTNSKLVEMSFGVCEGLTRDEIRKKFPDLYEKRNSDTWNYKWPDGESISDAYERAKSLIEEINETNSNTSILVVAHETINKSIVTFLSDVSKNDFRKFKQPNDIAYRWTQMSGVEYVDISDESMSWENGVYWVTE